MQEGPTIIKPVDQARQGVERGWVRRVLWVSTGAAIIALAAVYLVFQFHH